MIYSVSGKLIEINDKSIVVENNNIGFHINFPKSDISNLPSIGKDIKVYTYMNVKEDEISLYGFLKLEDKEMFLKLLTVNGVGPKSALNIISELGSDGLMKALQTDNNKLISSVSGIGIKTAKKICIELGDKVSKNKKLSVNLLKFRDDAVNALIKLGYKEKKAIDMLSKIDINDDDSISDIIKRVLRK